MGPEGQKSKLSHWGSILGAPSKKEVKSGKGMWCDGTDEVVVVVVRHCVHGTRGGEGVWAQNPKWSRCGSVAGMPCKIAWCVGVGRWCIRGGGGGVVRL